LKHTGSQELRAGLYPTLSVLQYGWSGVVCRQSPTAEDWDSPASNTGTISKHIELGTVQCPMES
jgi:hypothetical protein